MQGHPNRRPEAADSMSVNAVRAREYLADHPNQTAGQVAAALHISVGAAVFALNKLIRNYEAYGLIPDEGGRVLYSLTKDGDS